jgi:hypothetical protein
MSVAGTWKGAGPWTVGGPWTVALTLTVAVVLGPLADSASGQSLEREVGGAPDGWVVFEYATHRDVELCEDGGMNWGGSWTRLGKNRGECSIGVAQAGLRVRDGVVTDIEIGSPSRGRSSREDLNLGERDPQEVADYFLALAQNSSRRDVAEDALMPAVIAEGATVWPTLDQIARDERLDDDVRESAVFWLGQSEGGGEYLQDLYESVESDSLKEKIIFALSQSSHEEDAVEELMEIALGERDAELQKSALFWLGQSDDPRVADFLMDLIRPRVAR